MLQLVKGRDSSPTLRTLGQALPTASGFDGGAAATRQVSTGDSSPMLTTRGWLTHTSTNMVSSTVLPRRGAEPALSNVTAVGGRDMYLALWTSGVDGEGACYLFLL